MSLSDPIADMLTRIRNAQAVGHPAVSMPASKEKAAIAQVMKDQGYILSFDVQGESAIKQINVELKYHKSKPVITGMKRISKPSCRIYVKSSEIPRVRGGMGVAVLSTPEGVLAGKEAKRRNVGGEVICYVW
ncbi:30S ribosomal protein S8 [bacterium M21]|nr:30S ribosomal protein S8 [bacterium M21]